MIINSLPKRVANSFCRSGVALYLSKLPRFKEGVGFFPCFESELAEFFDCFIAWLSHRMVFCATTKRNLLAAGEVLQEDDGE